MTPNGFVGPDDGPEETVVSKTRSQSKKLLTRYPCGECGWITDARTYHPWIACLIVKQTHRDPLGYLQDVGRYYRDHPGELSESES